MYMRTIIALTALVAFMGSVYGACGITQFSDGSTAYECSDGFYGESHPDGSSSFNDGTGSHTSGRYTEVYGPSTDRVTPLVTPQYRQEPRNSQIKGLRY